MSKQYYLCCLIVFVTSSKGANIYLLDIPEDRFERLNPVNTYNKLTTSYTSDVENDRQQAIMDQFLTVLNHNTNKHVNTTKKRKTTCDRHFGSMFGTKLQKLQCIYDLNHKKNHQYYERAIKRYPEYFFDIGSDENPFTHKYHNHVLNSKVPFNDLTRDNSHIVNFSEDYLDVRDLARTDDSSEGFASNYVDINDVRTANFDFNLAEFFTNFFGLNLRKKDIKKEYAQEDIILSSLLKKLYRGNTHTNKHCALVRRNSQSPGIASLKTKNNKVLRANSDDSSEGDSTDKSSDEKEIPREKKKKPKRFQVIKHSESTEEGSSEPADSVAESENSSSDSEKVPRKKYKRKAKDKKQNFDNIDDKYVYTQGLNRHFNLNGGSDSDSDADTRRRLEHFLPKRYHWNEEDIPNLGYYWFNGIKGKYAGPRP